MPAQKNQHFVPRCALKPFTLNGEGAAINLFNLTRQRAIQNAPTKGQCARDYMYGKDLRAEQTLMKLEGHYARIVATLSSGGALPEADKDWLRLFICIQMQRTEHAINKIREWTDSMASTVYRNHPEQKPIDTQTDAHQAEQLSRTGQVELRPSQSEESPRHIASENTWKQNCPEETSQREPNR